MAPSRPRNPLPPEPRVLTLFDWINGLIGIVVVGVGQFLWQDGRVVLGWIIGAVGGLILGGILLRVAIAGLPKRRRKALASGSVPAGTPGSGLPSVGPATQDGLGGQGGQHPPPDRHDPTSR